MAKNLLNKYVWLAETIYKAKRISFEDINRRWLDNDLSELLAQWVEHLRGGTQLSEDVSPQWFRDEMAEKIKRMNNKYNADK